MGSLYRSPGGALMQQRRREVGGEDEGITWEVSMIYTPTRTACRSPTLLRK